MKKILSVLMFLLLAISIYMEVLQPIQTQRQQYQQEIESYVNGISA